MIKATYTITKFYSYIILHIFEIKFLDELILELKNRK